MGKEKDGPIKSGHDGRGENGVLRRVEIEQSDNA